MVNINDLKNMYNSNFKYQDMEKKLNKGKKLIENESKNGFSNNDKLKKVSEDFASIFIKLMLSEMKKTLHQEKNPLYGGLAEDIWSDMLYDEYSKLMAKNGLNSISNLVYQSLKNTMKQ